MDAEFAATVPHLHHRARNQVRAGGREAKSVDKPAGAMPQSLTAQVRRTVIALGVLAAVFYIGFILMMVWR